MKYSITHNTSYDYHGSADACQNLVRLQPRSFAGQQCVRTELRIEPTPVAQHDFEDYFGNHTHSFAIYEPHERLSITAQSLVQITPRSEELVPSPAWDKVAERLHADRSPAMIDALEFVFDSPYIPGSEELREFASKHFPKGRPLCDGVDEFTRAIFRDFKYDPKATTIDTSIEDVLEKRRGVCQDFAHLQIGCLRSLGLAARYVSGYLRTDPQPGKPRLVGADASHAWISVHCPENGWVDFDPTNGCRTNDRHITLGWGRDFHDVSPVKGVVLRGGEARLSVAVDVLPLEEATSL